MFTDILSPLEKTAYSVYPMSFYDDRETPTTMLLTVCEYMNKKWKYLHFSLETPSAMLDEIAYASGDTLPELSGDMNDQWGDFAAISPEWMSKKRKAMRRLFPGEILATFSALNGKEYDFSAFSDIIKLGSLFDEHCWATPFKVENHKFFTELSGGNAHDIKENMLICPQDFTVVEDWLAIQGKDGGIGIYSEDMPVFHLSQINYNKFMTEQNFPQSHVYLYAASNRTNNLNFRTPEDCHGRYRLSIIPYDGSCDRVLPEQMEELSQPIITGDGRCTDAVYSDSKLRLTSMRVFDSHSILFRFKELYGEKNERVRLTLPFEPTVAFYATLDGRELSKAEIYQNNVIFSALPHSYVTLKVCRNFDITSKSRKTSQIYNIFTVNIENKRSIVCFEKSDDLEAKGFRVEGDGKVVAEVQNQPERVQICELDIRCENVEIEPI